MDSIQEDFYVLDRNWNFVYASKSFISKIGKEPKDFIGNNIWIMFPRHIGTGYYEVAGSLRSDKEHKDTFLIALSGYAQSDDIERSREAGFNTHIAKPVNLATLEKVLVEVS
ncbi:MAG: response regulator [Desulfitobacteriaceae bacterium]